MFTAEEARKLAKEVKDKKELLAKQEQDVKKQNAIKLAEPIINNSLDRIKQVIEEGKYDYSVIQAESLDDVIVDIIITKFRELGYNVRHSKKCSKIGDYTTNINGIVISWEGDDEKMIYVKTSKDKDYEKVVSDFIKSLKQDKRYFEHKPVYRF